MNKAVAAATITIALALGALGAPAAAAAPQHNTPAPAIVQMFGPPKMYPKYGRPGWCKFVPFYTSTCWTEQW